MNPDITCSSCRKIKCESYFNNPIIGKMFKTCLSCRLRKGKKPLIIENESIKYAVNIEDTQDELIVTPGNRNRIIHMIIDYLGKDEKYKIEASENPNMFCIYLITRKALLSIKNGDNWKHIKH